MLSGILLFLAVPFWAMFFYGWATAPGGHWSRSIWLAVGLVGGLTFLLNAGFAKAWEGW
jgi:hypothetical protein